MLVNASKGMTKFMKDSTVVLVFRIISKRTIVHGLLILRNADAVGSNKRATTTTAVNFDTNICVTSRNPVESRKP